MLMTKNIETSSDTPRLAPSPAAQPSDLSAVKARQRATWASGDFGIIGTTLQIVGESLCEAVDLQAGSRVLDVAAGNGNASLAAARRFCDVTSTDYVPALLEDGRRRAEGDRLTLSFQEADAEALPFADESYDVVLSTFGVMFAPDHSRAAYELFRVCRSGGCIGLANWTPEGFIGQLFKVVGRHVPPPPGVKPPALWGTPDYLAGLFPEGRVRIASTKKTFAFRYRSAAHWIDVFRTWYGPVHKAFAALDAPRQLELEQDLRALIQSFDAGAGPAMSVPSEYLEVVIERL